MGVIYIAAKIFLAFPRTIAEIGHTAAWMIVAVATIAACISWLGILALLSHHPGKSLMHATEASLGPWVGSLVNLAYAGFFFYVTFIVLRQFGENIVAAILPRTPLPVVLLAFLGAIVYGALLGIEAIARSAWIVMPFMVIGVMTLLAGGLYTFHGLNALTPFWGPGLIPVVGWGLVKVSLFGEILVIALLAGQFRSRRDLAQSGWWTLMLSAFFFLITVVAHSYVFPYPASAKISFPLLEISRVIITGRWLQRLEAIFFIIWVLAGALKLAISLYGCARVLAHVMKLPQFQHLVVPLALLSYSAALLPPSLPAAVQLDAELLRNWGWVVTVGLPLITWMVAALRGRQEQTHA